MADIILKDEYYKIIGVCMEVHRLLGMAFKEIVYKDALALEFKSQGISVVREKSLKLLIRASYCLINITQILLFMILLYWK